jgi:hypothetical protein
VEDSLTRGVCTAILVSVTDVEIMRNPSKNGGRTLRPGTFAHSFVITVSRGGVYVFQAYGPRGYTLLQNMEYHSESGRNTSGTCFGETGLKIRPDVFRHDNCEQKKHVLLCKMSPASHFFLFEKGEKNNK